MDAKTIVGYHGTTINSANSIIENGFAISKDKYGELYLGRGIYFYAEYKDSIAWIIKKYRKIHKKLPTLEDLNSEYKIIKANITFDKDKVLDLNELENMKIFDEIVMSLEEKLSEEIDYQKANNKNGAIINYLIRLNYLEDIDIIVKDIKDEIKISKRYTFNQIYRKVLCIKNSDIINNIIIIPEVSEKDFNLVKYFFKSKSKVV